jgi:hypothetical protein
LNNTSSIRTSRQKKSWKLWKSFTAGQKLILLEALFFLTLAKLGVKLLPFKQLAKLIGSKAEGYINQDLEIKKLDQLRLVRQMIGVASRNVFWSSVCLDQAIAAKWMLNRRKIKSRLHFGVLKDKQENENILKAHAWLIVNKDFLVTGWVDNHYQEIAVLT